MIVSVGSLSPGRRLAQTVYKPEGTVLLRAHKRVDRSTYAVLLSEGYQWVFVESRYTNDLKPEQNADPLVWGEGAKLARRLFQDAAVGGDLSAYRSEVRKLVRRILGAARGFRPIDLLTARPARDYLYLHSVAVAILAASIAYRLGYGDRDLYDVTVGAYLHDLGMAKVGTVRDDAPSLSRRDARRLWAHPRAGYESVRKFAGPVAALTAYQHHERLDGSGYPRGLKGNAVHAHARIVAAADVFDALTSPRPYRPAVPPKAALLYLLRKAGHRFDRGVVHALTETVPIYPTGSAVRLSDGSTALIKYPSSVSPHEPLVLVVKDPQGRPLRRPKIVDLSGEPLSIL